MAETCQKTFRFPAADKEAWDRAGQRAMREGTSRVQVIMASLKAYAAGQFDVVDGEFKVQRTKKKK